MRSYTRVMLIALGLYFVSRSSLDLRRANPMSVLRLLNLLALAAGVLLLGSPRSVSAITVDAIVVFTTFERQDGIPVGSQPASFFLGVEGPSPDISSVRVTFTGPSGGPESRDLVLDDDGWVFEERFGHPDDIPSVYPAGDYTFSFNNGAQSITIPHVDPPSPFAFAMNLSPSGSGVPTNPASIGWACSPADLCDGPFNNFLINIERVSDEEEVFFGYVHAQRSLPTPGLTLDLATDYVLNVDLITVGFATDLPEGIANNPDPDDPNSQRLLLDVFWSGNTTNFTTVSLPSVSINDVTVTEGNSGTTNAVFTVTLSAASSQTVTVNYSTANGTATAGSDYVALLGNLTFNPGETSKPIRVLVNGDPTPEPNENFFVNLTNSTNAVIVIGQGMGTIVNDDADTSPPDTVIDSGPANPTSLTNASFVFHSTKAGSTFECQLDSGGYSSCTSPADYNSLADGSHNFQVRAINALGSTDPTPASYDWTVDTVAPNTFINFSPAALTNSSSATFQFTSTEAGTFECNLDGGGFSACATPKTYNGLGDGVHSFEVRAIDAVNNTDSTPASFNWTIDTTPSNTVIDSGPANPTESTNASFVFRSTETGSSFQCQLDGAGYSPCNSPKAYSGLLPGPHTFEVRATDQAGNTDATPASHTWTILPNTLILSGPAPDSGGVTNNTSATFSFTSTAVGSTFTCSLDGAVFTTCSSPQNYPKLKAGLHNFQVIANNSFGNDPTAASFSWTIDTKAPKTTITSGPPKLTNNTSATFFFTSTEVGSTFACGLDGSAFAPCTSPQVYNGLASGKHAFQVRATDPAGNTDKSAAKFNWKIQ